MTAGRKQHLDELPALTVRGVLAGLRLAHEVGCEAEPRGDDPSATAVLSAIYNEIEDIVQYMAKDPKRFDPGGYKTLDGRL